MTLNGRLIIVDPGHGGSFSGAIGEGGVREADINLAIAKELISALSLLGFSVITTRSSDTQLSGTVSGDLEERCAIERLAHGALFVSIHCNAADNKGARGFEVFTSPGETASDSAAESIITSVTETFPYMRIRSDKSDGDLDRESRFRVLTGTNGAAVLVEVAFMSNPDDLKFLTDKRDQRLVASAIASGILRWDENYGTT